MKTRKLGDDSILVLCSFSAILPLAQFSPLLWSQQASKNRESTISWSIPGVLPASLAVPPTPAHYLFPVVELQTTPHPCVPMCPKTLMTETWDIDSPTGESWTPSPAGEQWIPILEQWGCIWKGFYSATVYSVCCSSAYFNGYNFIQ